MGRQVLVRLVCDLCTKPIDDQQPYKAYDLLPAEGGRGRGYRLYLHNDCQRTLIDGAVPIDKDRQPVDAVPEIITRPRSAASNGQRVVRRRTGTQTQMRIVAAALVKAGGKVTHMGGHTWSMVRDNMTDEDAALLPSHKHFAQFGRTMQTEGYLEIQNGPRGPIMLTLTDKGRALAET